MKNGKTNTSNSIEGFGNAVLYFTAPIILKLMDILTTAKFLQLGVKEANPFIAWLMSIDMNLAYAVSFFGGLSAFAFLYTIKSYINKLPEMDTSKPFFHFSLKMVYLLLLGFCMYVVIHNLVIISYSDTRILI